MAKTLSIEIYTPERQVLKDEAEFVVVPASNGQLGVLPGHAPLLARLTAGPVKIRKPGSTEFLAVSGGFADVHPGGIRIFAETAEMALEIDVERARLAAERAREGLSKVNQPEAMAAAEAALKRALIRLRISEGLSRRRSK
ncbi:MAG: ATP synthase F1 subunit epsilon [Elusimicrobia bacterium RIFCSPHIGHO2_01_FULL_64_10]|nr:MAG: ATP synthase F1 subunit epsilon [Elusimicrobia bacterium RIFCSPHIGHO2_01_FULL_64_10]